ncbi:hypothetical protein PoB_006946800 [Plakobranchus ocellatus]|uniref:Uncharacterized protein n=1 Tax=Plakobranchus ocellatus TaxID=259542 RepID=A0AAV4DFA7_9GAST|nr:hypothetical protein PoB_006946800 [Plakobranchus ocellatus]
MGLSIHADEDEVSGQNDDRDKRLASIPPSLIIHKQSFLMPNNVQTHLVIFIHQQYSSHLATTSIPCHYSLIGDFGGMVDSEPVLRFAGPFCRWFEPRYWRLAWRGA